MSAKKKPVSPEAREPDSPPPIFATWGQFYGAVVANTILIYILLLLFSRFAR